MALRLSPTWIKEYCKLDLDVNQIADMLSQYGLETEVIDDIHIDPKLVIGEVIEVVGHPNADKLNVCKVDIGSEVLQIVCGCPTVKHAKHVVVAPIGSTIPGMTLKPVSLRGVDSEGMICSLKELGLAEEGSGIYHFSEEVVVGRPLAKHIHHDEKILEIDVTPNRGDCLSVYGVARDLAAASNSVLASYPKGLDLDSLSKTEELFVVKSDAVTAYDALVGSIDYCHLPPLYMINRLRQACMGLNHTVVDILNYVMLEIGQPMHAFDQDTLSLPLIMESGSNKSFKLLDDSDYSPKAWDTLVSDQSGPQALAGIMGGMDSRMQEHTKNIQLESAIFSPQSIAKSLRQCKLQSDASYRYERGVSLDLNQVAISYCAALLAKYTNAEFTLYQSYHSNPNKTAITIDYDLINSTLGTQINNTEIDSILSRLGIDLNKEQAYIPYYRYDMTMPVDLIEEVARLYGYNNIPLEPMYGSLTPKSRDRSVSFELKNKLQYMGFQEVVQFSFTSHALLNQFFNEADAIEIANPIHSEYGHMRTNILQSLIMAAQYNTQRQFNNLRLFEVGEVFSLVNNQVIERPELGVILSGKIMGEIGQERDVSFYDAKLVADRLLVNIKGIEYKRASSSYLHPNQSAQIMHNGKILGYVGVLHPKAVESLSLHQAAIVHLYLNNLPETQYEGFSIPSKYPPVWRDITVTLPKDAAVGEISQQVTARELEYVTNIQLKDIFQNTDGTKNVTWAIMLQSQEATLTDKIIEPIISEIRAALSVY